MATKTIKKKTEKKRVKKGTPISYGDYVSMEDDELCELREVLMDRVEIWLGHEHRREDFRELLEVEREITLREEDPR